LEASTSGVIYATPLFKPLINKLIIYNVNFLMRVKMQFNEIEKKNDIINVSLILIMFIVIFGISVITKVESSEFMGIDAKSIVSAINNLTTYPFYNMNAEYHSKYYGWTYFSLNFFIVILGKLAGLESEIGINTLIRVTLLIIGSGLLVALYYLSRKFFSTIASLGLVIYFMFDPVVSHYIVLIHPESLGMLLQILGCYFFVLTYERGIDNNKNFYIGVVFLSLSSLAKQPFFIVNFVIGCVFLWAMVDKYKLNGKTLACLFFKSVGIFLVCFILIHPYAFIEFKYFIKAQHELSSGHSPENSSDIFSLWFSEYSRSLIFVVHSLIVGITLFKKKVNKIYVSSLILASMVSLLFMYKAQIFINLGYLFPLYVVVMFNIMYFIINIDYKNNIYGKLTIIVLTIFFGFNFFSNSAFSTFSVHNRYLSDGLNTRNLVWDYLNSNELSDSIKMSYSPDVAIPQVYKNNGCHAWQGCANYDDLRRFQPDVIVYTPDYEYFESDDYTRYIQDNGFENIFSVSSNLPGKYQCASTATLNSSITKLTFSSFDLISVINNIQNCMDGYQLSLKQHQQGLITGSDIYVYKK